MYIKKIIICDDKNRFPFKEILGGYKNFYKEELKMNFDPDIFMFICDDGNMLLQKADVEEKKWKSVGDGINNDNKDVCASSFMQYIDGWVTDTGDKGEVVLVCMDFYWADKEYNEKFRDSIIEKINKKNNNHLKMIIYTTAAQQVADSYVADIQKNEQGSSALIGVASYDMSENGGIRKWRNIFKSVHKYINK